MKPHWLVFVLVALVAMTVWHLPRLQAERTETNSLRATLQSLNARLDLWTDSAAAAEVKLPQANLDKLKQRAPQIHHLRNEVTVALRQQDELNAHARKLAEQLHAKTNLTTSSDKPSFPVGYRPRHELANLGNATVESTVETFFWSYVHGNSAVLRDFVPHIAAVLDTGKSVIELEETMRTTFARFPGYRIVEIKQGASEVVQLVDVKTTPGVRSIQLSVVGRPGRWSIVMNESERF